MLHRPISALMLAATLVLPGFALAQAPVPLTPSAAEPPAGAIQVQELASLNPNELGLLDEAHGGLGLAMWKGSDLGMISKLLPLLPNQPGWRSLRALEIKLLESAATLPPGKSPGESLAALRTGKLAGMGVNDGVAAMLKLLPNPAMTPILRRLQIDSFLLAGDNASACAQAPAFRTIAGNDNYALEVSVFCQFVAGHGNEAGLAIDLLRDQKLRDPVFFTAADMLGGLPPGKIEGVNEATPVALAMANLAKLTLPENSVSTVAPAYLPTVARAPGATPETRLAAAERALNVGTGSPDLLRQAIAAVTFTPAELAGAEKESGKTLKGRALLYRAADAQTLPAARAQFIQRALASDPLNAPLLYGKMLAEIPASPDMAGFAPWAIRALLAGGQSEATRGWIGVLRADALLSTGSANAAAALKPLLRLAGLQQEPLTSADLQAWKQARNESAPDAAKHTLLLLGLLSALGETPPEAEWIAMLDGPPVITGKVSRSALDIGLVNAAAELKRGEAAIYALLCLGDQRDVEPAQFGRLVTALRVVGLQADARALALELALAYGI